jgi:aminomethyltransferase
MAYVAPADAEPGTIVEVEIRDQRVPARVVPLPFYKRNQG